MELIAGRPIEVDGITVTLEGGITRGSVSRGAGLGTVTRGDAHGVGVLDGAIARSDLRAIATLDLEVERIDVSSTRGAKDRGEPRIVLGVPPLESDEAGHIALVEEEGGFHWEFIAAGTRRFELEIDGEGSTERGVVGGLVRKAVRFLAVKYIAKPALRQLAKQIEKRLRKTRLRTFTEWNYHREDDEAPAWDHLKKGPAVLLIHGTNSRTDEAFGGFERRWVADLNARYDRRVFAFDHRTLSVSPAENAEWLAEEIEKGFGGQGAELDVLTHSRGGLVARELARVLERRKKPGGRPIVIRSVIFVATPNSGTPMADAAHLGDFIDGLTNFAVVLPDHPITTAIEVVVELVKLIAVSLEVVYDSLEGVRYMSPGNADLKELNDCKQPEETTYRAMAANFEPLSSSKLLFKLGNRVLDRVFERVMNDLIVPTRSAYLRAGHFAVPADQRIVFDSGFGIYHSGFWNEPRVLSRLDDWLRPDWPTARPALAPPDTADIHADFESALAAPGSRGLWDVVQSLANLPQQFKETVEALVGKEVTVASASAEKTLADKPKSEAKPQGKVVVLPGIMGSLLDVGGKRVWVSPQKLYQGGFADLEVSNGSRRVEAVGLHPVYSRLVARLARQWQVFLFPYDWRRDIFESAQQLAEFIKEAVFEDQHKPEPVHLVAHSMGGLVARAMAELDAELWKQIDDVNDHRTGGRLVMLGTPNHGSYAIPLAFLGEELLVRGLAALDRRHDSREVAEIIASFAGTYQMLPAPQLDVDDDHQQLFSVSAWGSTAVASEWLERADDFHQRLAKVVDPDRLVYVAGDGHQTPARLWIDHGKPHFGSHDLGDGRVTHLSGKLAGVKRFYYCSSSHGELVKDADVLDDLDKLLRTGKNTKLTQSPAARRGQAGPEVIAAVPASEVDPEVASGSRGGRATPLELDRAFEEATRSYLGSSFRTAARRPVLRVSVLHASLEQAKHPVAVGHYSGISPEGAEGYLDVRLDKMLRQHRDLGDYPETDHEVLFIDAPNQRPRGGIVLGLGEFGGLTRTKLVHQVTRAAIRRTMRAAAGVEKDEPAKSIGISAVLIGTPGRYGLSVETCVAALVEGVARAILQLPESAVWQRVRLEELEIVELFEVRATHAAGVARRARGLLPTGLLDRIDLREPNVLETGRGGRPGMRSRNTSGDPWPRIVVEQKNAPKDDAIYPELRFTSLGRSAQVDHLTVPYDDLKIRALIREAIQRPDAIEDAVALYELVFPHNAKLELDETDNLHLLVDEKTATIPWEILTGRSHQGTADAFALRTGMLRQLRAGGEEGHTRSKSLGLVDRYALVVGDPPAGDLPRLPGARREANQVAKQLRGSGYEVESLVFSADDTTNSWRQIQIALSRQPYRILHFATHGEVATEPQEREQEEICCCSSKRKKKEGKTGLVIGEGMHLTALDFQQMSVTPDFVFLNACHVGRTGSSPGGAGLPDARVNELAANVALQLMKNGVKAVVAAGWAVDDRAALVFAQTLYENMLAGEAFGEAVHRARRAAYEADGGRSNTWGAYQCYGDPSFELRTDGSKPREGFWPASPEDMIRYLDGLRQKAGDDRRIEWLHRRLSEIKAVDERHLQRFQKPEVYYALARAYAEYGAYEDAVWAYGKASPTALEGKLPLVVIEQLANMEVRLARRRGPGRPSSSWPAVHPCADDSQTLFRRAKQRLDKLNALEPTGERHALLGSFYKKHATMQGTSNRRRADLKRARDSYLSASEKSMESDSDDYPYHTHLWVQLASILGGKSYDSKPALDALGKLEKYVARGQDERQEREAAPDFWTDAALANLATSRAVAKKEAFDSAYAGYKSAFDNRSTVRQRDSVLDHLRDLVDLLPGRADDIQALIRKLEYKPPASF